MKKIVIISIVIVIGLVVISSLIIISNRPNQSDSEENEIYQKGQAEISDKVVLMIDSGEGEVKTFEVEFVEGITAFDLLKSKAEELNLFLKTKNYDFGIMIEAIGDKENGQDGKYWLYYVNGEMPMVSIDKQELKPGDKVEFKLEESSF